MGNTSLESVEQFKYFGTTLTNKNCIHEEIKSRLKSGNACHYTVHDLLSLCLISNNIKIKIYGNIILPVLYGCNTWFLPLMGVHKLRLFDNKVLRNMYGPKA